MISFNQVLSLLEPLLNQEHIEFGYQQQNCKKSGHYKIKVKEDVIIQEIKIDKNDNDAGKIYVLIHELTHFLNHHLNSKELTQAQKEVVADQVGKHYIVKFDLIEQLKQSSVYHKQNLFAYSQRWLDKRQFSDKKALLINKQIEQTIDRLNQYLE